MDYISRDDVLRKFIEGDGHDDDHFTEGYNFAVQEHREEVKKIPAADVQPVRRGQWKYYKNNGIYDTYKCSICNTPFELPMDADISQSMHYCPDCGAKMTNE